MRLLTLMKKLKSGLLSIVFFAPLVTKARIIVTGLALCSAGGAHANTIPGPGSLEWDILNATGVVENGGGDAFDRFGYSYVGAADAANRVENFSLVYDGVRTHTGEGSTGGLSVSRTIVVDEGLLFATYFDVFTNTLTTSISTTVWWGGNLGSDLNTTVRATSSGDLTITIADSWAVTSDTGPSDPVVAYALEAGADTYRQSFPNDGNVRPDNLFWGWDVNLDAGESFSMSNILWRGDGTGGQAEIDAAIAGISALASQSVPAPATLSLLGLGLIGLRLRRRA